MASVKKTSSWKFNWRILRKTNEDERDLVTFNGIICCVADILMCVCVEEKKEQS